MNRPNIFNYQNVVDYLLASFQYEKSLQADFSVRKWAKIMDLDSGTLIQILQQKKRVTSQHAQKIAGGLGLDENERKYLEAMIKLTFAELEREKQVLEIVLSEYRLHTGTVTYVEDQSVFSHWVHMAILTMSKVTHFKCTPGSIRDYLSIDVSEQVIADAIKRLEKLGLIRISDDGTITKDFDNVTSRNDVYKTSPHLYFKQVSDLAKSAADLPADEREFQCFSLAIDRDKLPQLKDMIRNFRAKLCTVAEADTTNQVYQMNIQLFPLSKKAESSSKTQNAAGAGRRRESFST